MFARRILWGRSTKCPAGLVGSMSSLALRLGTPSASVRFRTSLVPCLRQYPKAGDSFHLVFYRMIGEAKGGDYDR